MAEMKPVFLLTEQSEVYGLCWIQECPCYWYALEYNKVKTMWQYPGGYWTDSKSLSVICPDGFYLVFLQVLFSPVLDLDENVSHAISPG